MKYLLYYQYLDDIRRIFSILPQSKEKHTGLRPRYERNTKDAPASYYFFLWALIFVYPRSIHSSK